MSHVDFKKWPCRPVEFKGQGPPPSGVCNGVFPINKRVITSTKYPFWSSDLALVAVIYCLSLIQAGTEFH